MTTLLQESQSITIPPTDAAAAWRSVGAAVADVDVSVLTPDQLVALACTVVQALPTGLLRAAHAYRCRGEPFDVLLVRGLLPPDVHFGPTPSRSTAELTGAAQPAAVYLLAVALLLGEPFTFRTLYEGRLVQHVVPVPAMEFTQTGESSRGMLDWHVEDGFSDDRCDYFALLCLASDSGAVTRFAAVRDLDLPAETTNVLRQPRFEMLPDTAHVLDEVRPSRLRVLTGPPHAEEICYDAHYLSGLAVDDEAAQALVTVRAGLDAVHRGHVLERGDLLLLDNRRIVHARTPFAARYDGTDRWLMRTMVCSSLPRFRRHGTRIIG